MAAEGPPLWIWAIIAGAIIASKFAMRWYRLKQLARVAEKRESSYQ